MKQAVPYFGRFLSKLVLEIIPGALVSVFAAYLLSMLHLGAEPATTPSPSVAAVQNDGLSGDERRELTRQMLKERRENPEEPAEVKPVPSLRPASLPSETADLHHDHVAAPPAADTKLHTEPRPSAVATIAPPTTPLPRAPAPRTRTEAAAAPALPPAGAPVLAPAAPTVTAALPPPVVVAPGAVPPPSAPTQLPQVTVNAPANPSPNAPGGDLATQPQQRGIVGNIFSGVSTIAGGAANITGNTVNWVIDLPGKAISAGGKLLTGKDSTAAAGNAPGPGGAPAAGNGAQGSAAPAAAPPPTPLPMIDPQRRNFL
jgi:hypothetical protein